MSDPAVLEFFQKYLEEMGVFSSENGELLNGDSEPIPLLTNSFLNWFETQRWDSLSLLELGAGSSTLYFSKFFKSVTSYETSQDWFDELLIKKANNVDLIKVDSIRDALKENHKNNINDFDVILIDAGGKQS